MRHDLHHIGRCPECGAWTYKQPYCIVHLDKADRLTARKAEQRSEEAQAAASRPVATPMPSDIHRPL